MSQKTSTIALLVGAKEGAEILIETLSDDREIAIVDQAVQSWHGSAREVHEAHAAQAYSPADGLLEVIRRERERVCAEDEEFGNYVEDLLSKPFLRREVREHGIQWLNSKLRIERFQKSEREAMQVIANYAFRLYEENPEKTDFILATPTAQVRIRIFVVPGQSRAIGQVA